MTRMQFIEHRTYANAEERDRCFDELKRWRDSKGFEDYEEEWYDHYPIPNNIAIKITFERGKKQHTQQPIKLNIT